MKKVILLAILVALAGCQVTFDGENFEVQFEEGSAGGGGALSEEYQNGTQVTVTRVVDGDTVEIRYQNGTEDSIRFIGVDTPEIYSDQNMDRWEGVTNESCVDQYGDIADEWVDEKLTGKQVIIVGDSYANNRGYYDRLLRYIILNNQSINRQLVEKGYGRAYEFDDFEGYEQANSYQSLEADAQNNNTGVWSCS